MHVFLEILATIGCVLAFWFYGWCVDQGGKRQPSRYCRRCGSYHPMTRTPNCRR